MRPWTAVTFDMDFSDLQTETYHAESVMDYLRTTRQSIGALVTAAPLEVIYRGDGCCVLNIPVYLASRGNILRYAEKHVG